MTELSDPGTCGALDDSENFMDKTLHEIMKYSEDLARFPLYHGSKAVLETPQPGYGSADRDFGKGLYCTTKKGYAREWAVTDGRDGYMNKYTLDTTGLKFLDLSKKGTSVLYWLAAGMDNRVVSPRFDPETDEEAEWLSKHDFSNGPEDAYTG
ncbi:MAG: DUF3990 domain-containing protein [Clostridia bacterium]|nr:DUF3990 domain-containing protein [Clostridia bacterium]